LWRIPKSSRNRSFAWIGINNARIPAAIIDADWEAAQADTE